MARIGDIDFWRSHIIRQDYARSRKLTKALIEYQYGNINGNKPRLKTKEIREFVKLIRLRNANIAFELMTEKELLDFITEIGQQLE